ncbi:AAA family ATPase [Spirochaeta dissipatitropha]
MILDFEIGNYRSFKDRIVFSAQADPRLRSHRENIVTAEKLSLLRATLLYGPNAGGKSNFARAYYAMLSLIKDSFQQEGLLSKIYEPFLLNEHNSTEPTHLQLTFLLTTEPQIICRLGFEFTEGQVLHEWLYQKNLAAKSREVLIYERTGTEITSGQQLPNRGVISTIEKQNLLRPDCLLFSLLESLNNSLISRINKDFFQKSISASALFLSQNSFLPKSILDDSSIKEAYLYLLRKADTGIEDFKLDENPLQSNKQQILTAHSVQQTDQDYQKYFQMERMESQGTIKIFRLIGIILHTLKTGGVLIIDEIDTQLHPHLTQLLFNLFNDPTVNLKNAQLVAISHEHALLDHPSIRKDQVWFIQKNKDMASECFSLTDFVDERSAHSFGKRYLSGQYGAVPAMGDIALFTEQLFGVSGE